MTVSRFALEVAKLEGKKKSLSIAQISEVLKIVNKLTGGVLYSVIRLM